MKKVSFLSALLFAGTFVMSPAANAATVLTAKSLTQKFLVQTMGP